MEAIRELLKEELFLDLNIKFTDETTKAIKGYVHYERPACALNYMTSIQPGWDYKETRKYDYFKYVSTFRRLMQFRFVNPNCLLTKYKNYICLFYQKKQVSAR